jgi:hypothetical protein
MVIESHVYSSLFIDIVLAMLFPACQELFQGRNFAFLLLALFVFLKAEAVDMAVSTGLVEQVRPLLTAEPSDFMCHEANFPVGSIAAAEPQVVVETSDVVVADAYGRMRSDDEHVSGDIFRISFL